MRTCHACKKEVPGNAATGRREDCPTCGADLRCCLNCQFYDAAVAKQCRETVAELVREKAKANFCDYFVFMEGRKAAQDAAGSLARKALDDLFRK
jgi:hypothetical protein